MAKPAEMDMRSPMGESLNLIVTMDKHSQNTWAPAAQMSQHPYSWNDLRQISSIWYAKQRPRFSLNTVSAPKLAKLLTIWTEWNWTEICTMVMHLWSGNTHVLAWEHANSRGAMTELLKKKKRNVRSYQSKNKRHYISVKRTYIHQ